MEFNNKTILIIWLIAGGICSLFLNQENIASAIFGGLVGYLSKDKIEAYIESKQPDDDEVYDDEEI